MMEHHETGTVRCYTDGASRGNPGPSAYAFLVFTGDGCIHEESGFAGTTTNNVAEYQAVIHALRWTSGITHGPVEIVSDSELVMKQLSGMYAVRQPHLRDLYGEVRVLERSFSSVIYTAVRRDHPGIRRADELCNHTLDAARQEE